MAKEARKRKLYDPMLLFWTVLVFPFASASYHLLANNSEHRRVQGEQYLQGVVGQATTGSGKPAVVALGYRGAFNRIGGHCSDYFALAFNHFDNVIRPMQALGAKVVVFFNTYHSDCPGEDAALVRLLQPADYMFMKSSASVGGSQKATAVSLLLLVDRHKDSMGITHVVTTRFDILFKAPLNIWPLNWSKLNILARDKGFLTQKKTSDLFYAMPIHHLKRFITAVQAGPPRELHWAYADLVRSGAMKVEDIQFLVYPDNEQSELSSRPDGADNNCIRPKDAPANALQIMHIFRRCPSCSVTPVDGVKYGSIANAAFDLRPEQQVCY
eukprot:CAMPEP_0171685510 /NCGR_PEP_ID=MMETSP0991-20121206/2289_1 /TAXON_ID=483369 /ORGANISM="non described non described, Strain CCMP2098" /LENGTH=326 /DNA_ID=CAMNT_0012273167 /DNA_START=47 /DNA_END=1027 /DNA_ORIENTATION=-